MKNTFLLLILLFVVIVSANNFNNVVVQLAKYQDPQTGGFRASAKEPLSLAATADALFLAELYGIKSKINTMFLHDFVEGHRKGNSYSEEGTSPDVTSTLNAVLTYKYFGLSPPNSDSIKNWLLSLFDGTLFGPAPENRGTLKSTYEVVFALNALGVEVPSDIRNNLVSTIGGSHTRELGFDFPGVSFAQSTFYSLYILNSLGVNLVKYQELNVALLNLQKNNGGFGANPNDQTASFEASFFALAGLELLERDYPTGDYIAKVNLKAFFGFCRGVSASLHQVVLAHKAVSYTDAIAENIKFYPEFGLASKTNRVVQGRVLKPEMLARSFGGPSHPGLTISVEAKYESGDTTKTFELEWQNDVQKYVSETELPTADYLGPIVFLYSIQLDVFGVGPITFIQRSERFVGYELKVIDTLSHVTGRVIDSNDPVSVGTSFEFEITLSNTTKTNMKSGDFVLQMVVHDSSGSELYVDQINGLYNDQSLRFDFELNEPNYPPGDFIFYFVVMKNDKVHTTEQIVYQLSVPLVASQIEISGQTSLTSKFKLGETVKISIDPAALSDFKLHPIQNTATKRKIFLDLLTTTGVVIKTIEGLPAHESSYLFDYVIPTTFDGLGTIVLSFRYTDKNGKSFPLDNYNLEEESLYEGPLTISVDSDLVVHVFEKPSNTNLNYGNEVTFEFEVNDRLSNQKVLPGKRGGVYLALYHHDKAGDKLFETAKQAATLVDDRYKISWNINPNAIGGHSIMKLVAEAFDGSDVPLNTENGAPFSLDVTIGGEIKETYSTFSTSDSFSHGTVFLVQFSLSCNDVPLSDVKLKGVVSYGNNKINTISVGSSGDQYVASWETEHADSPSGTYKVEFYREVDLQRALEAEDSKQKVLRAKKHEAELSGAAFDEAQFLKSLGDVSVSPLFTVSINHSEVTKGGLPVKMEVILGLIFVGLWLYFDNVKRKYNQIK